MRSLFHGVSSHYPKGLTNLTPFGRSLCWSANSLLELVGVFTPQIQDKDLELKLISFFHEMGHFIDKTNWSIDANEHTKYKAEENAWNLGYELAINYEINFSENARSWAKQQLETYR